MTAVSTIFWERGCGGGVPPCFEDLYDWILFLLSPLDPFASFFLPSWDSQVFYLGLNRNRLRLQRPHLRPNAFARALLARTATERQNETGRLWTLTDKKAGRRKKTKQTCLFQTRFPASFSFFCFGQRAHGVFLRGRCGYALRLEVETLHFTTLISRHSSGWCQKRRNRS